MKANPCWTDGKDCPRRHAGCHATCEAALAWEAQQDQMRQKRGREMATVGGLVESHKRRYDNVVSKGMNIGGQRK